VLTPRWRRNPKAARFLMAAASLWLSPGSAVAQLTSCAAGSVCYYVAIQPIDVCSDSGSGCAPFNTTSTTGKPTTVSSTNPIGFVDATSGKDLTRAMANQLGVDIAWQPMRQYNSTSSQSVKVDSCSTDGTNCTSAQFNTLTDQSAISGGSAPLPSPPLNSTPTVLNMFFVNTLVPPSSGTLYGLAWVGANGIAISSNVFFPPYPLTPRYDTLAHELHHNLGLNHGDAYNYDSTAPALDLMTTGSARTEPTSTSNALSQLGSGRGFGTADQLDCNSSTSTCTRSSDSTVQQGEVATTGFLNAISTTTTTATKIKK
jgi:hypothetical protein